MNVGGNGKALLAGTKELLRHWNETKESWQDAQAREMQEKHLDNLWAAVDRAAPVFDQLDRVLKKIRSDCE